MQGSIILALMGRHAKFLPSPATRHDRKCRERQRRFALGLRLVLVKLEMR